jgi:uncharacterized protein YhhL (DUF1145 family)
MHTQTTLLKGIILLVWALVTLNYFVALPATIATILKFTGIFLLVAHTLECVLFAPRIIQYSKPVLLGFVQVFLFGIVYLRTLPDYQP